MTLSLSKLMAVVGRCEPKSWQVVRYGDGNSLVIHKDAINRVCFMATHNGTASQVAAIEAESEHIATFDPPTVKRLLAIAKAAKELHESAHNGNLYVRQYDALGAALEGVEL